MSSGIISERNRNRYLARQTRANANQRPVKAKKPASERARKYQRWQLPFEFVRQTFATQSNEGLDA